MKKVFCIVFSLCLLISCCAQAENVLWYPQMTEVTPSVWLTTEDGSNAFLEQYAREDKLQGRIDYVDGAVAVADETTGERLPAMKAQLKVRGNWTLDYPQKSIRIKFEKKQNLLGLNEGREYKSWVLLTEWKDLSKMNSAAGFFLAHQILSEHGYYCTDYAFVHVYVNEDYRGLYLLTEQQEVNEGRVEITEVEKGSEDRYRGYLMEYDAYFQEEKGLPNADPVFEVYHTGLGGEQYGYTIKSDIDNTRQVAFLRTCMRLIYRACYCAITENRHYVFNDKYTELLEAEGGSAKETVGRVVDLQSLVDTYILQEIVVNPDIGWSSFYMSLDMGEEGNRKLTFQAPWDFDSCFGIRAGYESYEGMYARYAGNPWLQLIASQSWFKEMVRARWQELKEKQLPEKTLQFILDMQARYAPDFERNYQRWPERIKEGNHELVEEINQYTSQAQAADYLYRWLENRFRYLDQHWQ